MSTTNALPVSVDYQKARLAKLVVQLNNTEHWIDVVESAIDDQEIRLISSNDAPRETCPACEGAKSFVFAKNGRFFDEKCQCCKGEGTVSDMVASQIDRMAAS